MSEPCDLCVQIQRFDWGDLEGLDRLLTAFGYCVRCAAAVYFHTAWHPHSLITWRGDTPCICVGFAHRPEPEGAPE